MKPLLTVALILIFSLAGCSNHYYRIKSDSLHLYLKKPGAKTVLFAFSKDSYEPHLALRVNSTTWEVTVPADVEFRYFFIVDGAVFLPSCQFTEKDDFGFKNCIFVPGL
jgi:hypothetical protein